MIRSVMTLLFGVLLAVAIIGTALLAAVWVIGLAGKAALFGDPRATIIMKLWERAMKGDKTKNTGITHITSENKQASEGS